jgi:hypothetical protein
VQGILQEKKLGFLCSVILIIIPGEFYNKALQAKSSAIKRAPFDVLITGFNSYCG